MLIAAFLISSIIITGEPLVAHASGALVKHASRTITIHSKASSSSKVVGKLPANAPVFVYRSIGSYYRINYKNKIAYTYKKYVAGGSPKVRYTGYAADTVYLHSILTGKTMKTTLYLATPIKVYAKQGHWLTIGYSGGYHGYAVTYDSHVVRYAKRGIDLFYDQSSASGGLDFKKVKQAGFHFAIIKASEGKDYPVAGTKSYFVQDVQNASKAGLKAHAYHMFDATKISDAQLEADQFARQMNPVKKLLGYAFVDVEYKNLTHNQTDLTNEVNAFINELKKKGYTHVGIYSNYYYYQERLIPSKLLLKGNLLWIARYNATLGMKADVWQHRDTNCTIKGVKGKFDFDLTYNRAIGG